MTAKILYLNITERDQESNGWPHSGFTRLSSSEVLVKTH